MKKLYWKIRCWLGFHHLVVELPQEQYPYFGILCLANSMTATRLKKLEAMGLHMHSMTVLYVKEWGFGYRTDFYVFTRENVSNLTTILT